MPYRADADALRTRCELLEKELADVRARASELASLKRTESDVAQELAKARAVLESFDARSNAAPSLDGVRIASPCKANWNDMAGDERVRFCGKCEKNVYNLSAMSRSEAEELLREKEGKLCARIFRRADGTVMTTDCPVGVRAKRVRRLAVIAVGGGALTAAAAAMMSATHYQGSLQAGGVMMQGDVAEPTMGEPIPSPEHISSATMGSVATVSPPPPIAPAPVGKPAPPSPKR
jgi:hypothetical protein